MISDEVLGMFELSNDLLFKKDTGKISTAITWKNLCALGGKPPKK